MTLSEALQLYAPLVGLLVMAFWLGVLSNRVKTLEEGRKDDQERTERERAEMKAAALRVVDEGKSDHDTLILVAAAVKEIKEAMPAINRELSGVQRQLANLMTRPPIPLNPDNMT